MLINPDFAELSTVRVGEPITEDKIRQLDLVKHIEPIFFCGGQDLYVEYRTPTDSLSVTMDHEGANADVDTVTQRNDLRIEGIDFEGMLLSDARRHLVPPTAEGQFGLVRRLCSN